MGAIGRVQLVRDGPQVVAHCLLADAEDLADLAVGTATCHVAEDLEVPRREQPCPVRNLPGGGDAVVGTGWRH